MLRQHYRIEHLHKLGTMGAVYKAFVEDEGFAVAVKENLIAESEFHAQFIREARFLATFRHPNLPRGLDYFEESGDQFLIMDWVQGEDLHDWSTHEILPAEQLIPILEGVFQALSHIHSLHPPLIHKDVSPSNIILTPDHAAVLVDFGLAKALEPDRGPHRVDQRSDQYSLGATIYSLLTRQLPADALKRALGEDPYVPASFYEPDIPSEVDEALDRALAVKPEDRYPDVASFWDGLNAGFRCV